MRTRLIIAALLLAICGWHIPGADGTTRRTFKKPTHRALPHVRRKAPDNKSTPYRKHGK